MKNELRFITVEDLFNEAIVPKIKDTLFNKFTSIIGDLKNRFIFVKDII